MLRKLEAAFAAWPAPKPDGAAGAGRDRHRRARPLPHPEGREPGARLDRPASVTRDNPDVYALEVMNEILGGSGFTSRITRSVRSNEGLAYSAGSGLSLRRLLPRALPRRVPVQEPHRRLRGRAGAGRDPQDPRSGRHRRGAGHDPEEPDRDLPEQLRLEGAGRWAIFASDEYTRRDPAYWSTYRDRIRAVTAADVAARGEDLPGSREDRDPGGGRPEGDRPRRRQARRVARQARPGRQGA